MSEDLEVFQTIDLEESRHRHKMELAQEETRRQLGVASQNRKQNVGEARWETLKWFGVGFLILVLLAGVGFWIYSGTTGNDKPNGPDPEIVREANCVNEGGGFVPKDLLISESGSHSDHGICVFPGKVAGQ